MLAGAFYGRIHSLTGPGGIGIQLQDVAASASDTNDGIKKLQKVSASQKTAIKAALKNIDELNGRIAELEKRTGGAL
jgi:peptidoglycan hydrolase CwlO-like protein